MCTEIPPLGRETPRFYYIPSGTFYVQECPFCQKATWLYLKLRRSRRDWSGTNLISLNWIANMQYILFPVDKWRRLTLRLELKRIFLRGRPRCEKKNQKSTGNLIDRIKTGYEVENSIRTQALQMVVQINCCQKRHQDDIYVTVEPDHYFRKQRNYNTREKYSSDFPIHVPLSTAFDV